MEFNRTEVKPVVLSQCLAKPLRWNWERWFLMWWCVWQLRHTLLFFSFLLQGKQSPLAPGNHTGKLVFQCGVCLWVSDISSKKRVYVLTVHDIFGQKAVFSVSGSQVWQVFFVKQTLAYLPVADWTVSFAFFSWTFSAVQWLMSCCISSCFFYVKK